MSRRTYTERRSYSARVMRFRQAVYAEREPVQMVDLKRVEDARSPGQFERALVTFTLTNGCRLLLLRLSDDMDAHAKVSVSRSVLAADLGVKPIRITEYVATARVLGFLGVVRRGRPGVTAVYEGYVPGPDLVRQGVPTTRYGRADHDLVRQGVPTRWATWYALGGTQENVTAVTPESACMDDAPQRGSNEKQEPPDDSEELAACDGSPCPHGMPDGDKPDPWLPGNRMACTACALELLARTKDDRKKANQ